MAQLTVERDGPLAVITFNLPEVYMTGETVTELNEVTQALAADDSCRALIFTGGQDGSARISDRFHRSVVLVQQLDTDIRHAGSVQ